MLMYPRLKLVIAFTFLAVAALAIGACAGGLLLSPTDQAALKSQVATTQVQVTAAKADADAKAAKAAADAKTAADAQAKAAVDAKAAADAQAAAQAQAAQAKAASDAKAAADAQTALLAAQAAAVKAAGDKIAADAQAASAKAASDAAQKTLDAAATVQSAIDKFNAGLAKAVNPDGTLNIAGGAQAIGGALPPPWNLVALIGIPLIVGGIQEFRKRQSDANAADSDQQAKDMEAAAKSLVNSVDVLKTLPNIGPQVVAAMNTDAVKSAMQDQLTPTAKAIVASEKLV